MGHIIERLLIIKLVFNVACIYARASVKPDIIIEPVAGRFEHAEGPHWDYRIQKLYFVDIPQQKIHRLDPETGAVTSTHVENGPVGVAVPVYDSPDQLVAGAGRDFVLVKWNSEKNLTQAATTTLASVDANKTGNRWNDGKVDSSGRFWGGTIGPEVNDVVVPDQATFYRITENLVPKTEIAVVTNSNGLAWNLEDNTLYYIDTPTLQVAAFDFDPTLGTISNRRVAFDLAKNNVSGLPDGMTIDTNGNLWVAVFNGGCVVHANPKNGQLLKIVEMPAKQVTSVAFGGPFLDTLYVTTSSRGLSTQQLTKEPHAGYVFAVRNLGVHGLLANEFRLNETKSG